MAIKDFSKSNAAHEMTDGLAKSAHEALDVVAESAASAEQTLRDANAAAKKNIQAGKERVLDKSSEISESMREYTGSNPLMALGIAFATGLLVSAVMRK